MDSRIPNVLFMISMFGMMFGTPSSTDHAAIAPNRHLRVHFYRTKDLISWNRSTIDPSKTDTYTYLHGIPNDSNIRITVLAKEKARRSHSKIRMVSVAASHIKFDPIS